MEDGEAKWTNKCDSLWTVNVYLAMSALQFTGLTDLNLFPCYHFWQQQAVLGETFTPQKKNLEHFLILSQLLTYFLNI